MKLKLVAAAAALLSINTLYAQQNAPCASDELLQRTIQSDPNAALRMQQNWEQIDAYIQQQASREDRNTIVTIPVVFHVIHSGQNVGTGLNLSDAQLQSQLDVLNECYRKHNADTALVPNIFKSRIADIEVEFCLAVTDPSGNNTTGITRHSFNANPNTFDANIKPVTVWDATRYLNIWTTQLNNGILGYATFPNMGPMTEDGVVLDFRVVGRKPFNPFTSSSDTLGKTCVHEVGHWLGLYHTFQDSCKGMTPQTCATEGDRVCDTPPAKEANYGNPSLTLNSCNESPIDEPDMWMNYMDYANSENLHMFTTGQRDIMRATLNTFRLSILSSTGCVNVFDEFAYTGQVVDAVSNQAIANAKVLFDGAQDFEVTTDANGNFSIPNLVVGYYDVYAGKWGYRENFYASHRYFSFGEPAAVIPIQPKYYYDDFIMNFGWITTQTNATAGLWTRAIPVGTFYQSEPSNPALDLQDDYGLHCFVTANNLGSSTNDDVDGGTVTLISPVFDLTGFNDPYVRYYRWFFDGAQSGNTPDDNMVIRISNGNQNVAIENLTASENRWTQKAFRISDYITPTATMRFSVEVSDLANGNDNVVEGGLDKFEVLEAVALSTNEVEALSHVSVYPNPTAGTVRVAFDTKQENVQVEVLNTLGQVVASALTQQAGMQQLSFDISNQTSGLYFVRLSAAGFEKNVKIEIECCSCGVYLFFVKLTNLIDKTNTVLIHHR